MVGGADVWLNGQHLTTHYGGYLPFTIDIGKAAVFQGDNLLTVRLDNSDNPQVPPGKPQNKLDFTYFGGLYRSVSLEVLNPLHISDPMLANKVAGGGVFVTCPKAAVAEATVQVRTDVVNESSTSRNCTVTQTLVGPDGTTAGTASDTQVVPVGDGKIAEQRIEVVSPKLWHPYHPYLYMLHTVVMKTGRTSWTT